MRNLKTAFHKEPPSFPDLSVRSGIDAFIANTNFTPFSQKKLILHEAMHVLGNAASGSVADEGRAIIYEFILLGGPSAYIVMNKDDSFRPRDPDFSEWEMKAMAHKFMKASEAALATEIGFEKVRLIAAISELAGTVPNGLKQAHIEIEQTRPSSRIHPEDLRHFFSSAEWHELEKLFSQSEIIKSFEANKSGALLTKTEFDEALLKAQRLHDYFRETHNGRRVQDFRINEILEMKLSEFGLQAVRQDGQTLFQTISRAPHASSNKLSIAPQ